MEVPIKAIERSDQNSAVAGRITDEVVLITPAMASQWLENNRMNRPISRQVVATYARDMANGDWHYTGDAIQFATVDGDQVIIDGQHRLLAIIRSKAPQWIKVERGYPPETIQYKDQNRPRRLADQLQTEGHSYTVQLVAIARRVYNWEGGPTTGREPRLPTNRGGGISTAELREVVLGRGDPADQERYQLLLEAARYSSSRSSKLVPPSATGFLYYVFVQKDPDLAVQFLDRVDDGASEVGRGDPILALRNRMINMRASGGRVDDVLLIGYSIMAWNLVRKDKKAEKILPPRGGFSANFPRPI